MMPVIQRLSRLIKRDPKTFDSHYIFENAFSKSELSELELEMERLRSDPSSRRGRAKDPKNRENYLCTIHTRTDLFKDLAKKIDPLMPFKRTSYDYYSMNFYHLEIPYALHCDNLGPGIGHYQIVIPLSFSPSDIPPYTILFDQTSAINTEWISPVYKKSPDYTPYHNKPIYDPKYYPFWTDEYKISEQDGLKYWGPWWNQMYREAYKGFSIKFAYQWKIGDLFLFDSRYNHCASFLGEVGLTKTKRGILVCLQQPQRI